MADLKQPEQQQETKLKTNTIDTQHAQLLGSRVPNAALEQKVTTWAHSAAEAIVNAGTEASAINQAFLKAMQADNGEFQGHLETISGRKVGTNYQLPEDLQQRIRVILQESLEQLQKEQKDATAETLKKKKIAAVEAELKKFLANEKAQIQQDLKEIKEKQLDGWEIFSDVVSTLTDTALAFTAASLYVEKGGAYEGVPPHDAEVAKGTILPVSFGILGALEGANFLTNIGMAVRDFKNGKTEKAWMRLGSASISALASIVCISNTKWFGDFLNTTANNLIFFPVIFGAASLLAFVPAFLKWKRGEKVDFKKDILPGLLNLAKFVFLMAANAALGASLATPFGWIGLALMVIIAKVVSMVQKDYSKKPAPVTDATPLLNSDEKKSDDVDKKDEHKGYGSAAPA